MLSRFFGSFGAVIAIVALALGPFAQQIVTYRTHFVQSDQNATIPSALNYTGVLPGDGTKSMSRSSIARRRLTNRRLFCANPTAQVSCVLWPILRSKPSRQSQVQLSYRQLHLARIYHPGGLQFLCRLDVLPDKILSEWASRRWKRFDMRVVGTSGCFPQHQLRRLQHDKPVPECLRKPAICQYHEAYLPGY